MVVVVSAMGKTTDQLIDLAHQISDAPEDREMDVLMSTGETVSSTLMVMALHAMGHDAISLSGGQAGIRTDKVHRKARIMSINPKRMHAELEKGRVVIVAGFQGLTQDADADITTLGRGGSDTTAVALAAALGARACEIYTDVEGVYTADPRIVPEARKLDEISYDEMLELASVGAKVMHSRAVEVGGVYNIPILVASSFKEASGTLIHGGVSVEQFKKVRGIAHDLDVAKVTVRHVPDQPGIAAAIFEPLTEAHVSVDTIVQNASEERLTDLTFTVSRTDLREGPLRHREDGEEDRRAGGRQRREAGQGEHRRDGHAERARLRLAHVPHALRCGHQHRHDLDERDPHHLHRRRGPGARTPSRRCTRPSRWTRRVATKTEDSCNKTKGRLVDAPRCCSEPEPAIRTPDQSTSRRSPPRRRQAPAPPRPARARCPA